MPGGIEQLIVFIRKEYALIALTGSKGFVQCQLKGDEKGIIVLIGLGGSGIGVDKIETILGKEQLAVPRRKELIQTLDEGTLVWKMLVAEYVEQVLAVGKIHINARNVGIHHQKTGAAFELLMKLKSNGGGDGLAGLHDFKQYAAIEEPVGLQLIQQQTVADQASRICLLYTSRCV